MSGRHFVPWDFLDKNMCSTPKQVRHGNKFPTIQVKKPTDTYLPANFVLHLFLKHRFYNFFNLKFSVAQLVNLVSHQYTFLSLISNRASDIKYQKIEADDQK